MRCSRCGSENRESRKLCLDCGALLSVTCPKCGISNQPVAKFCGDCGAPLHTVPPTPVELRSSSATVTGERRHLTILLCDLVGSTEIAGRLDPEEWHETVAAYHRAAADAINRFGGHTAHSAINDFHNKT